MGKFFSSPKVPKAPALRDEKDTTEEDKAAERLRLAEKRRRGRRASILGKIGKEEALSTTVERPEGRAAKVLFGG